MNKLTVREKLKAIVSNEPSNWANKAQWRIDHEKELDITAHFAIEMLKKRRRLNISNDILAEKIGIPLERLKEVVEGDVILTSEEIIKMESFLEIS